jgi:5-methyltetrahydrofolate--homocysteine methyltransferase
MEPHELEALADRLAEAFAELLHHRARISWSIERPGQFTQSELIHEKYQGIRPAPGYPSQPDHTEKDTLWNILDAEQSTGVQLTESRAMNPGASVCGLYFSNSKANYFNLGRINQDQVEDYAARKGWTMAEAEKWLRPNLSS